MNTQPFTYIQRDNTAVVCDKMLKWNSVADKSTLVVRDFITPQSIMIEQVNKIRKLTI